MTDNDRKLPPKARAKIYSLIDLETSLQTAMQGNLRQINELGKAHDILTDDARKAEIKQEVAHRQDVQSTQRERLHAITDLNAKIRRFLDLLPANTELDDAKPPKIKLKQGQSHQQAIAEVRGQVVALISERSQVERCALPTDEIKAQVKKWITERAMQARPAIIATHEKFDVKFSFMDPEAFTPTLDPLALFAWLDPEYLEGKLNELVDEMPVPKLAMTPAQKSARLKAIKAELDTAERLECALIDDAQDHVVILDHRPNVSIPALLGLVVSKKKANAA